MLYSYRLFKPITIFVANIIGENEMRKIMKKFAVVYLSLAMIVGVFPAYTNQVIAKEEKTTIKKMAKGFAEGSDAFDFSDADKAGKEALKSKIEDAPEKFDLRNVDGKSYVTPVKFQNPFGTCWGFAATAAAETSILGSDLAVLDGLDADTFDLSEKHLAVNSVKALNDPNNSQNGEGRHYFDKNMPLSDKLDMGGFVIFASSMYSSGIGPVVEELDPLFEYSGKNKWTDKRRIDGVWQDYCYSEDDDWDIPEAERFTQSYELSESFMLPSPAQIINNDDEDTKTYKYNPEGTMAIKDQILQKRAVAIAFCADTSMPDQTSDGKYISKNWAHYTDNTEDDANHAVTVVGWDDNYPKENFIENKQPPHDGAFLVKNSWGSGENEFPNKGPGDWGIPNKEGKGTGYFWLSYYDQSLDLPESMAFERYNTDGYNINQYDFMPVNDFFDTYTENESSTANVFKAETTQSLDQIGFVTASPGTKVKYNIYILPDKFENPTDGIKVLSGQTGAYEYGGFHKLKLPRKIKLNKGQNYSIEIQEINAEGTYSINVELAENEATAQLYEMPSYVKGVVNKNESFLKVDGKWNDISNKNVMENLISGLNMFMTYDNFPIKGYCLPEENLNTYFLSGNNIKLDPYGSDDSEETIRLAFKGNEGIIPNDCNVDWELMQGGEKFITLTKYDDDPCKVKVAGILPGTAYIKVTTEGYGTQVIKVEVVKDGKYQFDFDDYTEIACGESEELTVYEGSASIDNFKNVILKSANPKIATFSNGILKGISVGKTYISVGDSKGYETTLEVRVKQGTQKLTAKGKTIKINYKKLKKKKKTYKRSKIMTLKGVKTNATYKITSVKKKKYKKYFKINSKTGKLTIKKKLKKGKYKVKVRIRAVGNTNYKVATKNVTVNVKVK